MKSGVLETKLISKLGSIMVARAIHIYYTVLGQVLCTDHVLSNLMVRVFSINSTTNNKGKGQSELMGLDWMIRD